MDENKQTTSKGIAKKGNPSKEKNTKKSGNNKSKFQQKITTSDPDVLLNLPAGLKYKMPGRRQRIIIGSLVVGLNALLVIAVLVYLYNPDFQSFVYNLGR